MTLLALAEKHNFTCYWCHNKFRLGELSRDHIIPILKHNRGQSTKSNSERNRSVLACKLCNHKRGKIPFFIYKQLTNKYE